MYYFRMLVYIASKYSICWQNLVIQKNARVVSIEGYEDVPENDEKSLMKAVANQPVSVAIEGGGRAFQHYSSVWWADLD